MNGDDDGLTGPMISMNSARAGGCDLASAGLAVQWARAGCDAADGGVRHTADFKSCGAPDVISISIVSHLQGGLVKALLDDLAACVAPDQIEVILTVNAGESLPFAAKDFRFPLRIILNETPKGFGANHNAAARVATGEYFCVTNPDIRLTADPFPALQAGLSDPVVGVAAPLVTGPEGRIEDSARRFPTPMSIACKVFRGRRDPDYAIGQTPIYPDWVAGMFMLWRAEVFRQIGGFDEGFFLYYEDVDACARLHRAGFRVILMPAARVTHHAQRASHRSLRYLRWHLSSMFRFFRKQIVG